MINRRTWVFVCGTLTLMFAGLSKAPAAEGPMLEPTTLGSTRNVHAHGTTLLCGQPSPADLAAAKEQGIQVAPLSFSR